MGSKNNPGKFDCVAKAAPDEPMFTLLGRDPVAAAAIRFWIVLRRIVCGEEPELFDEALSCANACEGWARNLGKGERVVKAFAVLMRDHSKLEGAVKLINDEEEKYKQAASYGGYVCVRQQKHPGDDFTLGLVENTPTLGDLARQLAPGNWEWVIRRDNFTPARARGIVHVEQAPSADEQSHVDAFRPGLHKHYKGALYRALFLARDHETQRALVVYVPLSRHGDEPLPSPPQVRPLCTGKDAWNDEVPVVDRVVRRFTWIAP